MRAWVAGLAIASALVVALAPAPSSGSSTLPPIRHVWIIILENENSTTSFGAGSAAPYLAQTLTSMGQYLPNYYGIGHASNDNYIAMISGQGPNPQNQADCQDYDDFEPGTMGPNGQAIGTGCVYPSWVQTIAGQLNAAGYTWKAYEQDMGNTPSRESATCGHPELNTPDGTQEATTTDQYATRHDPFVYFHSIIDSPICDEDVVNFDQLAGDLQSVATTPNYSFITPNLCDDGHDSPCANGQPGGLVSANQFLEQTVPEILASPAFQQNGLLMITFDESASGTGSCCGEAADAETVNGSNTPDPSGDDGVGDGGGQIGAVLVSPYIQAGTVNETAYNHYSMLASIENLFGLSHLGFAAVAGLPTFGGDVFDRATPAPPPGSTSTSGTGGAGGTGGNGGTRGKTTVRCVARALAAMARGALPAGSLITAAKLVVRRGIETLEVALVHSARLAVNVRVRSRVLHEPRFSAESCRTYLVTLPVGAGRVSVTASVHDGRAYERLALPALGSRARQRR
jgi:hypothetical protein